MDNTIIDYDCKELLERFVAEGIDMRTFSNKRILLTGATGLIGTYFLYLFKQYSNTVRIDFTVNIVVHNGLPDHLKEFENCSWLNILCGDLVDYSFLQTLTAYDIIIHAAGYGQPGKFMENQEKTLLLNTMVTDELLKKVVPGGDFLFVSTSEVYSGSDKYPYTETTHGVSMPDHIRACYIEGKRCGEAFCYAFKDKINVKIARVALAYGPGVRADDKRVLYNFIQKGMNGQIEMLDGGTAQRVYCYISDTVEILFKILISGKEIVYNVGGKDTISIKELAELVAECLNAKVIVPTNEKGKLEAAPAVVCMDISRVIQEFKKDYFIPIDIGVRNTVKWYSQYFE